MTFDSIAIHDGRMAGLKFAWHLMFSFDLRQVADIFNLQRKAIGSQVLGPCATATSGGRFINGNQWPALGWEQTAHFRASTGRCEREKHNSG